MDSTILNLLFLHAWSIPTCSYVTTTYKVYALYTMDMHHATLATHVIVHALCQSHVRMRLRRDDDAPAFLSLLQYKEQMDEHKIQFCQLTDQD